MRMRYHELIGKRVIAADGKEVGHVADLSAEACGDALCVTALLVGPTALLRRIGSRHLPLLRLLPPRRVPWSAVARVGQEIEITVESTEIAESTASFALPEPAKEAAAEEGG